MIEANEFDAAWVLSACKCEPMIEHCANCDRRRDIREAESALGEAIDYELRAAVERGMAEGVREGEAKEYARWRSTIATAVACGPDEGITADGERVILYNMGIVDAYGRDKAEGSTMSHCMRWAT